MFLKFLSSRCLLQIVAPWIHWSCFHFYFGITYNAGHAYFPAGFHSIHALLPFPVFYNTDAHIHIFLKHCKKTNKPFCHSAALNKSQNLPTWDRNLILPHGEAASEMCSWGTPHGPLLEHMAATSFILWCVTNVQKGACASLTFHTQLHRLGTFVHVRATRSNVSSFASCTSVYSFASVTGPHLWVCRVG